MIMEKYLIEDWNPVTGELEETVLFTPSRVTAERRQSKFCGDFEGLTTGHVIDWIDLSQFKKKKGR